MAEKLSLIALIGTFLLGVAVCGHAAPQSESKVGIISDPSGMKIEVIPEPNMPTKVVVLSPPVSGEPTIQLPTGISAVPTPQKANGNIDVQVSQVPSVNHVPSNDPGNVWSNVISEEEKNLQGIQKQLDDNGAAFRDLLGQVLDQVANKAMERAIPPYKYAEVNDDVQKAHDAMLAGNYKEALSYTAKAIADLDVLPGLGTLKDIQDIGFDMGEAVVLYMQRQQLNRAYAGAGGALENAKRQQRQEAQRQATHTTPMPNTNSCMGAYQACMSALDACWNSCSNNSIGSMLTCEGNCNLSHQCGALCTFQ